MKISCELAQGDKFNRILCTANNMLPCTYQRYCTMESEWQNTDKVSQCERRKNMSKRKNQQFDFTEFTDTETVDSVEEEVVETTVAEEEVLNESPIAADETLEDIKGSKKVSIITQENKRTGVVDYVTNGFCVIKTKDGQSLCLFKKDYLDRKPGDVVEY